MVAVLEPATASSHPHRVRTATEPLGGFGKREPSLALPKPIVDKPVQLFADNLPDEGTQNVRKRLKHLGR